MTGFIPFALPEIGQEEIDEVVDSLKSGWITTGPKAKQFEEEFASYVNSANGVAVNSATAGLHLALEAIGVEPGDTVITTPYTFTATAEVVRYLGADPIFVDIEPDTFNIDPEKIARLLGNCRSKELKMPKAIIPVHFGGQSCEMDSITQLSNEYGLKIIEDAAHALPCTYKGRKIGAIGDITVFSFYATKTITTGEGGMLVTNNSDWAKHIKTMRLHGINRDVFDRYSSTKPSWFYEVVAPGFKYNMPDISAAMGLQQLKKAERFRARREYIANTYNEAFKELPLVTPFLRRSSDKHSWHLYVIQLDSENTKINRNLFIERMSEAGIGTSVHFIPLHIQPYWRERYGFQPEDFPIANDVYQRAVSLPIYSKMSNTEVQRVIDAVSTILR